MTDGPANLTEPTSSANPTGQSGTAVVLRTNWPVDPTRPTTEQPALMNCLIFASDHRGYAKKSELLQHYPGASDCGAFAYDPEDDYNDPVVQAIRLMFATDSPKATVFLCGSAHGVCMQANRFRGVRAINADSVE